MAKKDKFEYSTDYLAKIHAPEVKVEEVAEAKAEPTKAWDEKGVIAPKAKKTKGKAKA